MIKKPIMWAVIILLVWAAVMNGLYLLVDRVFPYGLTLMLCFMLVYPVTTFAMCFLYAKCNGITALMPFGMIPVVVLEYAFIEGFRAIIPNILVITGFCILFGSGMGSIFADKEMLEKRKKDKLNKKLGEDRKYKKILDD